MKLLLVTDAWIPQDKTRPCPGYAGIDLAVRPRTQLVAMVNVAHFDAVHIVTEEPLGWAALREAHANNVAARARSQDFIWAKASQLFVSYVRKISV